MAILNSEHLFAQAEQLIKLFPKHKPRQTELRRAASAAYYGLYHYILKQAADEYVGAKHGKVLPPALSYALAYRSISHTAVYSLCSELKKAVVPGRLQSYSKAGKFGQDLRGFAASFVDLQEQRHTADYDLSVAFSRRQAVSSVALARTATLRFEAISKTERRMFLALLLFPPRGRA